MSQSPTKQTVAAEGRSEDDLGDWALDLKSNAFESAMNDISSGFESERAAFEREFLTKFRELRRPVTKEIIDAVNSGRAAVEVVNDFFDKAIAEVVGFMHGRRQLDDALQGKLVHATHHVLETGIDAMLRRDREKKAFLKQSFENRIEESRVSSKVELSNAALVMEAKFERQISELKERAQREAEALGAMLRAKDEDMRVAQAQFNSKLAAEKAGSKHYADQLKADLESSRAQLEFLRRSTASTSSAKSVLESERKALGDEMARLVTLHKEERQRNELQMHKLRTELDEVKASQAAERKKIKDTTEQASKQLEVAHDQLRSMQFELQAMQQKMDVSSVRLAESEGSLKDLYGRYRESQSILSETLSSKDEHERAALIAQDTIIELTRGKDELSIMLQESKERVAAGEATLAEMQSELETVLKAQERNRKKLVESEMKVTMLNNDLASQRSKQKELEATIQELNEEIESLKIARDAASYNNSSKNSSLAQELEALQAEFDDARAVRELDKQGAEELIASLRAKIAELESRQDDVAQHAAQSAPDAPSARSTDAAASTAHVVPGLQPAASTAQHAARSAAVAQVASAVPVARANDVPVLSASLLSSSTEDVVPVAGPDTPLHATPLRAEAASDAGADSKQVHTENQGVTRIKSRTPAGADAAAIASESKAPADEPNQLKPNRSKPGSRDSHASKASSAQSGTRALSSAHPLSAESAARLQLQDIESVSAQSSLHEDARLWTASVASTSSGLSVLGMSGVQAASVFMDDAGKSLLIDSASEVKPTSASDTPSTADTFNALNRALGDYGFDNESSSFISTSLLRQQSAFMVKLTQQRDAFEACIESFKSSAAAQMELQLVHLSKAHETESVQAAKALNENKKVVIELKKKIVELNARISLLETQALQPRGVDAASGNTGELQAKLEHAGLQMQAYLNVIEEQRAQISVFLNALKSVGGASDAEIDLFKGSSKMIPGVKELRLVLPSAAKTSGQMNTKNMHATYTVVKRSKSTTPAGFEPRDDASGTLPSIRQ